MVVAIDGPAGSGKSTVAKIIADKLGFVFLNSGSFYRGVSLAVIRQGVSPDQTEKIIGIAGSLDFGYAEGRLSVNGEDVEDLLHSDSVDAVVAQISAIIPVRHIVNKKIHDIAGSINLVCEGRDMTTVVFPDADFKFFLDASPEARAERRFKQGVSDLTLEEITSSIKKRDEIDRNKSEGALVKAPDAEYFDTSYLTINQVCDKLLEKIQS